MVRINFAPNATMRLILCISYVSARVRPPEPFLLFHVRRKTGEVLRILDTSAAINHTLEVRTSMVEIDFCSLGNLQLILFNTVPTFIDIIIALVLFAFIFDGTLTVVFAIATSACSAFAICHY